MEIATLIPYTGAYPVGAFSGYVSLNPATVNFGLTLAIMNPLLGWDNTKNFGKEFKCMMTAFLHSLDN